MIPSIERKRLYLFYNFLLQKKGEVIVCLIIILLCQLIPTYEYYKIEKDLQKFRNDGIENQEIKEITFVRYQPGKTNDNYPEIKLANGVSYALVTENWNDQEMIKIGDIINKNKISSKIKVNDNKLLIIKDLNYSKIFHRIFMFIVSLFPIYILIFSPKKKSPNT